MKAVLLHNIPSPYRMPLLERLAARMELFVYFMGLSEKQREWKASISQNLRYKVLPSLSVSYKNKSTQEAFTLFINPTLFFELVRRPYDVIVIGGFASLSCYIAFFISKLRRKPVILWVGNTIQDNPSKLAKIASPVIRLLMKSSEALLVYGTMAKQYVVSFGVSPEKVFIAINVGDTDFFMRESDRLKGQKEALKKQIGIKSKLVILYAGRLIELKGVRNLVEAFSRLKLKEKDAALVLVGEGSQKQELMERYRNVEGVHFVGFAQPEDLPSYYAIADIFVLPTLYDRFSIVVSEAMASGLAVITTEKDGAAADLLRDGVNGYVVREGDVDRLREVLEKILAAPELCRRMGENSRMMIQSEFNLDTTAQGFLDAIEYVTEGGR